MKEVLFFVGGFLGGFLFTNFVKEVISGNPGGALVFLIILIGFLAGAYFIRRRHIMLSKRQNKAGENSH